MSELARPANAGNIQSRVFMDTVVTIEVRGSNESSAEQMDRAFGWFGEVERICSRFDENSELRRLSRRVNVPVRLSPILYHAIELALVVAAKSEGAFDPTIGRTMEAKGFDHNFRTGRRVGSESGPADLADYHDLVLDRKTQCVTLARPLALDLGAVAKGFATDLAAKELAAVGAYAINAGGDVFVHGCNGRKQPWSVGIRHPRQHAEVIWTIECTNGAICTSGDYERRQADGTGHHILEPRSGASARSLASVTVFAPTATVADALSTAAFVLGPTKGLELLEGQGVEGLLITPELDLIATKGFPGRQP